MSRKYEKCEVKDSLQCLKNPIKTKNYYKLYFNNKPHWIWVYSNSGDYNIICVLKEAIKSRHATVIIDGSGQKLLDIISDDSDVRSIGKVLQSVLPINQLYYVESSFFEHLVLNIEVLHSTTVKELSIGVILVESGQTKRDQWFKNKSSTSFLKFVTLLGNPIDLKEWYGFKGNMKGSEHAFYKHWRGIIPTMYHVAPLLSEDDCRSIIGNDILVIIYTSCLDNITGFDLEQLGKMTQCIAVVSKIKGKYYLRFYSRGDIPDKGPFATEEGLKFCELEEILIGKFYRIMNYLHKSSTFGKMYTVPRQRYINSIIESAKIRKVNSPRLRISPRLKSVRATNTL